MSPSARLILIMEPQITPETLPLVSTESLIEEIINRNQAVIIGMVKISDSIENPLRWRMRIFGNELMLVGLIRLLSDRVDEALAQKYEENNGVA